MKDDIMKANLPKVLSKDGGTQLEAVNILIVGQIGGGKSSFMNSIATAFNDHLVTKSDVGVATGLHATSLTKKVK